jgi:cytoskeleton protein RodZ
MKTVGKQLQDARAAKGWSPELAARETKIRVDRLHDLEVDDYSNFSSPTYARGFVRTYARALGLDEYKILRQLDNKLPEDDNASFANDTGVAYMPEPSQVSKPFEFSRGVYIAGGVAATVLLLIGFILIQSYRAGYFASAPAATPAMPATNALPVAPESETARAMPADGSAPPVALPLENPPAATAVAAPAASPIDTNAAPRALPVNPADLAGGNGGNVPTAVTPAPTPVAPPDTASAIPMAPVAQPAVTEPLVTPAVSAPAPAVTSPAPAPAAATTTPVTAPAIAPVADAAPAAADTTPAATVPTTITTPPRALPVDLNAANASATVATPEPAPTQPHPTQSASARQSNSKSTVNVAAANSATESLIASAASAEPPPATAVTASALTGTPDNAGTPATTPMAETSSPENSAPSSLGPVALSAPPQAPSADSTSALTGTAASTDTAAPAASTSSSGKFRGQRLVLTASHDSFVRVIALDGSNGGQVRYASTLRSGESISFNDRRYSINVADPSAVDIALDGINYGPHSENSAPDTFTVESHTP